MRLEETRMDKPSTLEVETELDELIVRILELMNQYIQCKINIENYIRSGCIDLAKARYINGNRRISALQLPTEDSAGVKAKFKVLPTQNEGKTNFQKYESMDSLINFDDDDISSSIKNMDLNSSDDKTRRFSNDPLKWFGVLVPQSLRQSKTTFEKCLDIVVESVNVQLELGQSVERYKELRKQVK